MSVLLLDFGASRIKGARWDPQTKQFLATADLPAPEPHWGADGAVEIAADAYARILADLTATLGDMDSVERVYIASEMHGFLLADAAGGALTPYISWRDERAARSGFFAPIEQEMAADFRAVTGMKLRPGLPFVTLAYLAQQGALPADARLLSLPEWVMRSSGGEVTGVDETMAAASGLYDLTQRDWSAKLRARLPALHLNPVANAGDTLGTIRISGRQIPVTAAIGDLQAAVLGSAIVAGESLCLNLGTGSQVNMIRADASATSAELRPYTGGRQLVTLSHIPAGRALQTFAQFYDTLAGGTAFWPLVAGLEAGEIFAAPLTIDLNLFAGAWRWQGGGGISGLTETNFTPRILAASLIRSWLIQYVEALAVVDPARSCPFIRLAGGLPRRIPALVEVLATLSGREVIPPTSEGEETLRGLASLAK